MNPCERIFSVGWQLISLCITGFGSVRILLDGGFGRAQPCQRIIISCEVVIHCIAVFWRGYILLDNHIPAAIALQPAERISRVNFLKGEVVGIGIIKIIIGAGRCLFVDFNTAAAKPCQRVIGVIGLNSPLAAEWKFIFDCRRRWNEVGEIWQFTRIRNRHFIRREFVRRGCKYFVHERRCRFWLRNLFRQGG